MTITYALGIPGGVVIAGPSDERETLYYCKRDGRHPVVPAGPFFAMVIRGNGRSLTAGWPSLEKAVAVAGFEDAINRGNVRRTRR